MRLHTALTATVMSFAVLCAPVSAQEAKSVHAIAMHGQPKYGPGFTHFDYVNPNAPKGGTIRYGSMGGFDTFNGFIPKGESADGLGLIYDTLLTSSADEAFSEYGLLAESLEMPEDRSWIVFHLRKEARWHDGQPVTAQDVKWTFDTLIEKGAPHYKLYYADVTEVQVIDPLSVKFVFKNGENKELPLIVGQLAVLPKHYWETRDFGQTTLEPPLGSGPYKIGKFEPGRTIEYERVADYWGRTVPANVGQNNFDTIRYDYFRDANVAVEAFKGGAFDFRNENTSKIWATAYDTPEVASGQMIKDESPHQRTQGMQGFAFNLRRDLFKDVRVRQALAYAFDFEWTNRNLFYGQYTRSRSYFDNSELSAKGLPEGAELAVLEAYRGRIPDEVFTKEYNPPATQGDGRIRDNLKIADQLLKDAGWVIQGKDLVNATTGERFAFEILLVQPAFERITLPFAKNLERLGIQASVRTIDTSQYIERVRNFDYDMMVAGWGESLSPGNEQRNQWGSSAADQPSSDNVAGIKDPVIDELIEKIIAAPDRESLVAHVRALDRILQWGHYVVPHWHITYDRLIYWNKFSHPDVTPMQGAQIGAWWYDAAKAQALDAARGKKP